MKYIRKLYDWVLSWAYTPYGAIALFIFAFAESSFFPIPPDVLLIALVLGARKKAFRFALICTIGSISGAIFGYLIGHYLWWTTGNEFSSVAGFFFSNFPGFTEEMFFRIQQLYSHYNFWIVFAAGFTPLPYKVFTVSAGAFNINFPLFMIASIIGRGARFFLVSALIWKYGPPIKSFIDKYFNLLAILFTILLIGGFVLINFLV